MEYATPLHELESQEQLLSIRPHRLDVETNILTILLQHLSKVHASLCVCGGGGGEEERERERAS